MALVSKNVKKVKVIRYRTINACLAAFYNCSVKELDSIEGYFEYQDADGTVTMTSQQVALKQIRQRSCWGWVENKTTIHVFVRKRASLRQVMALFAHEQGHMQRPYHRSLQEEQKASIYAEVACGAFDLAMEIKGG